VITFEVVQNNRRKRVDHFAFLILVGAEKWLNELKDKKGVNY